jgi:choline dehydrogenase-like flavoprotein
VIKDLVAGDDVEVAADVLVIGGGTVGLLMAVQLAERGHLVVVVESGGREQSADTHELNEVVHTRAIYGGAARGRFRCLGGTSTRWGGALIPFVAADCLPEEWPIPREELETYIPVVESLFDLAPGSYEGATVFDGPATDFRVRMAKWPAFSSRNVASLLAKQLQALPRLNVWLNATATEFGVAGGLLKSVTARSRDGATLRVSARQVIIAAGAIETTRLLLLMDMQHDNTLFAPDRQLGRYFSDHLSVAVGDIKPRDRSALNVMAGFRFERGGSMRNVRYELTDNTPLRQAIPPCFAHIAFVQEDVGGFAALRDLFRQVQKRRLPDFPLLLRLILAMPWLVRAAWWRFVRRRLLYPASAAVQLHMVVEQRPRPESCIRLSASRKDLFGQPLAEIQWDIAPIDSDNFLNAVGAFENAWNHSALAKIAELQTYSVDVLKHALAGNSGIFHPVGSARMAKASQHGVVDSTLRPFRVQNVSIVSTAVLPRSGGANPTMMLLLLGLRCVNTVSAALNAKAATTTGP